MNSGTCMSSGSAQSGGDWAASLEQKVAALRAPDAYTEKPAAIETIETHFAWVFLTDEHAFKLKKPIRTAFLDLSTLAARRFNCSEELRLNQRLAHGVYLDVVPLTMDSDGALRVTGRGVVVDWLVKMRRLPSERMLDRAIIAGRVPTEAVAAVGRRLVEFYRVQRRIAFEPSAYVTRIRSRMEQDRSDLLAPDLNIACALVESVMAAQASACLEVEPELRLRALQWRIVEGHGDLRPEHICLTDPPCVIDSLEFSQDLRTLDPGEELAYLCIECARLGDASPGDRIVSIYRAESGDLITSQLLDFYRSRRATVRAKLVAWHLRDPEFSDRANWRVRAEEYLQLGRQYAGNALLRG